MATTAIIGCSNDATTAVARCGRAGRREARVARDDVRGCERVAGAGRVAGQGPGAESLRSSRRRGRLRRRAGVTTTSRTPSARMSPITSASSSASLRIQMWRSRSRSKSSSSSSGPTCGTRTRPWPSRRAAASRERRERLGGNSRRASGATCTQRVDAGSSGQVGGRARFAEGIDRASRAGRRRRRTRTSRSTRPARSAPAVPSRTSGGSSARGRRRRNGRRRVPARRSRCSARAPW